VQDLIAFDYDIGLSHVFEGKRRRDLNPKRIQAPIHDKGVSKQVDSFSLMVSPLGLRPKWVQDFISCKRLFVSNQLY
jgi:hypothetical protein